MARKPGRRATYEDLRGLPEHVVGEILDGELIVSPRPAPAHANAGSVITADLNGPFHRRTGGPAGPGGWWILYEPELHLHGDVVVPDLAGWRRERMPHLPDKAAFELPPDWVCEIISPSTARIDRARKMPIYARERVAHLWLVDPPARSLEVFRLDGEHWKMIAVHGETAERIRAEPFDAIEIDVTRWWAE